MVIPGLPAAFTSSLNGLGGDIRVPFLPRNLLEVDQTCRSQLYNVTGGNVLIPVANYGEGTASGGFPDGTNVRSLQLSLRFQFR